MSLLENASPTIFNATLSLLNKYPAICERYPGFRSLEEEYFDDYQVTLLIGTIAASAITVAGGVYGMFLNRNGTLPISALFLTTSALGAAAFYFQYKFLETATLWIL